MAGKIVVGVDGTEHAVAALRWAIDEAKLREATVEAVHAWRFVPMTTPADAGLMPLAWSESTATLDAVRDAAERLAEEQVAAVTGGKDGVKLSVVEGDAVEALLDAARDAELLVVGNRGRGGLKQALLGSTSASVCDRAPCPVVVVRAHPSD